MKHKDADVVSMLAGLRPTEAIMQTVGREGECISLDLLEAGDIVKVANGSSLPEDVI